MSRIRDNWERLVNAALKRELLRELALYCESLSSTASDFSCHSFLDHLPAKPFSFEELKNAARDFHPDSLLGEGEFGYVFKGWIDEHTLTGTRNSQPDANLVGRGRFGNVFKGWIHKHNIPAVNPGSRLAIAVKKLKHKAFQDHEEWMTQVNNLAQLRHPNLVKLIGYCSEGHNRLLVYEFMPNGSLEDHLFTRENRRLSWKRRINVAIGVARGLAFLHDREPQLKYGDVKTSSILLDEDTSAKLSGFTLADKHDDALVGPIAGGAAIHTQFFVVGRTAPEYIYTGTWTAKSDVYSFGVVLLELLCGRPAVDQNGVGAEQNLVEWARKYFLDKRKLLAIMDTKLEDLYPKKGATALAALAFQCLSQDPKLRPSMTEVLGVLEQL